MCRRDILAVVPVNVADGDISRLRDRRGQFIIEVHRDIARAFIHLDAHLCGIARGRQIAFLQVTGLGVDGIGAGRVEVLGGRAGNRLAVCHIQIIDRHSRVDDRGRRLCSHGRLRFRRLQRHKEPIAHQYVALRVIGIDLYGVFSRGAKPGIRRDQQ